jgi:hypothetical protein
MLCMLQRVPEGKERISQLAPDLFQDIVQGVEKRIDALEREHPDQADVCVLRRAELANLPDGFDEDLTHPAWLDSISPASYPQVVAVLGRMRWQFLTVDGQAAFLVARLKLLVCEHQIRDQHRRLFLHGRDGVRVGVERDRDGGVPEPFGDDFGMDAGS